MKNKITIAQFSVIIGSSLLFIAAGTVQDHKQNKKEHQQKESKQQAEEKRNHKTGKDNTKQHPGNAELDDNNTKSNNEHPYKEQKKKEEKDSKPKNDNVSKEEMKDGYKWDKETFQQRKKYRNLNRATICHKFSRNSEAPVTISVSSNGLKAHLNHGDVLGDCPAADKDKLSDNLRIKRTIYYNSVQDNEEQVSYSQSILHYALERLTTSRQQLALTQNNNASQAELQRKQAAVDGLEQDVSLLQTMIGVSAKVLSDKLQ